MHVIVTKKCANWGDLGETLRAFADAVALTAWVRIFTVAEHTKDSYALLLLAFWAYQQQFWYVLVALFRQPQPHSECAEFGGVGMPVYAVYSFYAFSTFALSHDFFWVRLKNISYWRYITLAVFAVFIPLVLAGSGNYSGWQVVLSAILGVVTALVAVVVPLFVWWHHYLELLDEHPLIALLGFRSVGHVRHTWTL